MSYYFARGSSLPEYAWVISGLVINALSHKKVFNFNQKKENFEAKVGFFFPNSLLFINEGKVVELLI